MRKRIKRLLAVILIFATLSVFVSSCKTYREDINSMTTYIVNTRSMKVHSLNCGSAKLISDKNREEFTDSIMNLCSKGYKICKNCNAGLSRKYVTLAYELPTKQEYLDAIDAMGEWYVNNIPTYCKEIKEVLLNEYDGQDNFIMEYSLIDKHNGIMGKKRNFNVISSNQKGKTIESYDAKNTLITSANENAVNSYKNNFSKTKFEKNLAYYNCEYLTGCKKYDRAGDDCVRFVFSVLNYMDNCFVDDIVEISNRSWRKINSDIFRTDTSLFLKAMQVKGFNVFDTNVEKYNNGIERNNGIIKMDSNFKLEKGDIIIRDGHVHIFMGDSMIGANNFGWGKVSRVYPANYNYYLKNINNDYYIICDHDKISDENFRLYTRVYRYVGGINEE